MLYDDLNKNTIRNVYAAPTSRCENFHAILKSFSHLFKHILLNFEILMIEMRFEFKIKINKTKNLKPEASAGWNN